MIIGLGIPTRGPMLPRHAAARRIVRSESTLHIRVEYIRTVGAYLCLLTDRVGPTSEQEGS